MNNNNKYLLRVSSSVSTISLRKELGSGFKKLNPTLRFGRRVEMLDCSLILGEESKSIDEAVMAFERPRKYITYLIYYIHITFFYTYIVQWDETDQEALKGFKWER